MSVLKNIVISIFVLHGWHYLTVVNILALEINESNYKCVILCYHSQPMQIQIDTYIIFNTFSPSAGGMGEFQIISNWMKKAKQVTVMPVSVINVMINTFNNAKLFYMGKFSRLQVSNISCQACIWTGMDMLQRLVYSVRYTGVYVVTALRRAGRNHRSSA